MMQASGTMHYIQPTALAQI